MTVKNLTIDGMTVDYTATVSSPNAYHAFGALAGFVGDRFTAENVTVKHVTMKLNLLGEEGMLISPPTCCLRSASADLSAMPRAP